MNWHERLYQDVLMYLPDAPQPLVERAILTTASDFFRDTQVLSDELYIPLLCNNHEYLLPVPEGQRIVFIERVSIGNCGVTSRDWRPLEPAQRRHEYGYWVDLNKPRPAIRIPPEIPNVSACDSPYQLAVEYAWTPDTTQCRLPEHIIGRYATTLLNGVLAALYGMRLDETLYDPAMAREFRAQYERERDNAMNEKHQNFQTMPLMRRGGRFI
jgi:hypothetical protein